MYLQIMLFDPPHPSATPTLDTLKCRAPLLCLGHTGTIYDHVRKERSVDVNLAWSNQFSVLGPLDKSILDTIIS